ncbi:MAG: tetratricopeptide repeat protein [Pseudomonas sp.]
MTAEARRWYEAAAEQGDLFAMLRLSSSRDLCHEVGTCGLNAVNWRSRALGLAYERAEQGDTEAMRALFNAGQGIGWLEKAAEGGDAPAQRLLAGLYRDGEGWFLLPGRRQQAIEKWYRASAEGGFPLGMMEYANILGMQERVDEASSWIRRAAEGGYIEAVYTYASYLAHMPDKVGYPLDLVKAYGLMYLLALLEGGGGVQEDAQRTIDELEKKMTSDQIEKAKAFAAEWERTHPPLSFFVPVYGY